MPADECGSEAARCSRRSSWSALMVVACGEALGMLVVGSVVGEPLAEGGASVMGVVEVVARGVAML